MENLLKETIDSLEYSDKTDKDVLWVGLRDGSLRCSWDEFAAMAVDLEYEEWDGVPQIHEDLIVFGRGWWLEREYYDGCSSWRFKESPELLNAPRKLNLYHIVGHRAE